MVRKRTIVVALFLAPTPVLFCCALPLNTNLFIAPGISADQLYGHERWVRPGMTPDDVRAVFGPPHQLSGSRDGVSWLYYEQGLPVYRAALVIDFDKSGTVGGSYIAD